MKRTGWIERMFTPAALVLGAMFFTTCGLTDRYGPDEPGKGELPVPPAEEPDTVYVTGVEYPAGYDWSKDPEYGTVECRLFLEKDGKRVLEIPVGYFYETASDPDMHRCIEGHLYTDYSTESETVVKKDGVTLFRYPGREMSESFHVSDSGDVYTVGYPRSGEGGFTFRKNGNALLRVGSGSALSDIHQDDGRICLTYRSESTDIHNEDGYYAYIGGRTVPFAGSRYGETVLSARVYGGRVIYVMSVLNDSESPSETVFHGPDGRVVVSHEAGWDIKDCKIEVSGQVICLAGYVRNGVTGEFRYCVWDSSGELMYCLEKGVMPYYSFGEGGSFYDLVGAGSAFGQAECYVDGKLTYSYSPGTVFYGDSPAVVSDGKLHCIFSGKYSGGTPYKAVDGSIEGCDFNGYFTGISVW